ncbi:sensor domain-containing protein [Haladaptatus sp. NG-SE-30]
MLYLGLAFPLGLIYFVTLITGFALGIGLSITLIGIPLLLGVIVGSRILAAFERNLAIRLLDVEIPKPERMDTHEELWPRVKTILVDATTWKGLFFLFLKFPLGIASFVLIVTAFALTVGLVTAPLHYANPWGGLNLGWWDIDTLAEALVAVPLGLGVGIASLYLTNLAASASGYLARYLLSGTDTR